MNETLEFPFWGLCICVDFNLRNYKTKREFKAITWKKISLQNCLTPGFRYWVHHYDCPKFRALRLVLFILHISPCLKYVHFSRVLRGRRESRIQSRSKMRRLWKVDAWIVRRKNRGKPESLKISRGELEKVRIKRWELERVKITWGSQKENK